VSENLGYEVTADHDLDKYRYFPAGVYDAWEQLASGGHEQPWRAYSHCILFCPQRQAKSEPFRVVETHLIAHQVDFDWESGGNDSADERIRPQQLVLEAHEAWGEDRVFSCCVFVKIAGKRYRDDFDCWLAELNDEFYAETYGEVAIHMTDYEAVCRYQEMVGDYHRLAIGTCHLRMEWQSRWERREREEES
jgi:hypothetical protein